MERKYKQRGYQQDDQEHKPRLVQQKNEVQRGDVRSPKMPAFRARDRKAEVFRVERREIFRHGLARFRRRPRITRRLIQHVGQIFLCGRVQSASHVEFADTVALLDVCQDFCYLFSKRYLEIFNSHRRTWALVTVYNAGTKA